MNSDFIISSKNTDESRVSQDEETGESEYDDHNTFLYSVLIQAKVADLMGLEALGRPAVSAISREKKLLTQESGLERFRSHETSDNTSNKNISGRETTATTFL